ncbi:MAG: type II secretion system protein [Leptothrix sp. (in: b-proteobacteria)]
MHSPTPHAARRARRRTRGFTLMELVVVMTVIGLLLTIALPRFVDALDRGKEKVLERNLSLMREAIDHFYGDQGKYPEQLEDLVSKRYLRAIPPDPFLETATWVVVAPADVTQGGVIDVESTGNDADGRPRTQRRLAPAADADPDAAPSDGTPVVPRSTAMSGSRRTVTVDAALQR